MSTVESRIAGGTSKRNAGDKNKKIALVVVCVVFVALLVYQVPKLMHRGGQPTATTTDALAQLPPAATTPTTVMTSAASSQSSAVAAAQLRVLRVGPSRDPFAPLVKEPPPPSSSAESATPSSSPPAGTPVTSTAPAVAATATMPTTPTPSTETPTQPLPAPTAAVLWTNGRRQIVGLSQVFKVADTSFRVADLSRNAVQLSVPGGAFADGRRTLAIRRGHQIALVNTATGVRYVVRFASGTFAAPTVGAGAAPPKPTVTTQTPATPTAPTTTTAGATQ